MSFALFFLRMFALFCLRMFASDGAGLAGTAWATKHLGRTALVQHSPEGPAFRAESEHRMSCSYMTIP